MASFVEDLFDLKGRVALVTGASSGIGRHMAQILAAAGAHLVVVGRDRDRLADATADITSLDYEAVAIPADLQIRDEVERVARESAVPFGAPDILVNAAGINLREAPDDISWESWELTLKINLSVPFFLARTLVNGMRAKGGGNIINIASLQSYRAFANSMAYGASKGGVAQLTRAMAEAWSKGGIVVNAILPGFFPTNLTQPVYENPDMLAYNAKMTAIGRNGEMTDLDGVTVFLASRAAAYITGQIIPVDGGLTAK
ncbi:MAG TPA: SDR family oxidoreductase [Rhodospirillales bacterium]|jgi:gluconate 5-dehydrogenase|nr:SDR family oxidoreductase [Rhodospirillales bacterium]HIM25728.1 SDR family oxidoreductase [Rhodospirillales bacterium]HIM78170.1 SDR family oxidoreductase [Rhodospirillales bacterium]